MTRERSRLLELDTEARELAHTEFETPLVIEAGAGTGKTALLTARAVAWCVGPGWELHAEGGAADAAVARRVRRSDRKRRRASSTPTPPSPKPRSASRRAPNDRR